MRESAFRAILDEMIKGDWKLITRLAVDLKDLQEGHETVNKPIKLTMPTSMSDD